MAIDPSTETTLPLPAPGLVTFVRTCRRLEYSRLADILYLFPEHLEPGYTVELGNCFAYRVSFDQKRLVAIEIHNFRAVVLQQSPQLARAWKEYTNPFRRWAHMRTRAKRFLLEKVAALIEPCDDGPHHFAHA